MNNIEYIEKKDFREINTFQIGDIVKSAEHMNSAYLFLICDHNKVVDLYTGYLYDKNNANGCKYKKIKEKITITPEG